ncbi:TRAP transporter substrate-binding protein [Arhodomonas sp. AD133]|uniref:TRAP transporter substrate-binding protein n=1 Tax=Arhodomonas sp. AD133 TaxID=3415009 RepID=UPI003EBED0DA
MTNTRTALTTAACLVGLAVGTGTAAAEQIRIAGNFPANHSSSLAIDRFEKQVEEATNGDLQVDVFPAMQLGGAGENVDQVRSGAIFATWIGTAYLSRIVPELEAVSLPFLFDGREQAFEVIDGEVGDRLAAELGEKGFETLGWMELGARHVTNSQRPLETMADFEGLKIRLQPNETHIATFNAVGANPVSMDIKEVYSALQQHVLDGQENPYTIIRTRNFEEVQSHLSDTSHFFDFIVVAANQNRFEALPPEHRKVVREAMADAVAFQRERAATQSEKALAALKEKMTFTPLPDDTRAALRGATSGVVDRVRERTGDGIVDLVLSKVE